MQLGMDPDHRASFSKYYWLGIASSTDTDFEVLLNVRDFLLVTLCRQMEKLMDSPFAREMEVAQYHRPLMMALNLRLKVMLTARVAMSIKDKTSHVQGRDKKILSLTLMFVAFASLPLHVAVLILKWMVRSIMLLIVQCPFRHWFAPSLNLRQLQPQLQLRLQLRLHLPQLQLRQHQLHRQHQLQQRCRLQFAAPPRTTAKVKR